MAKSPLTNLLGSANMGGFFAPEMRWAGFDHLVIRGRAEKPVYLYIHDGAIEIRSAEMERRARAGRQVRPVPRRPAVRALLRHEGRGLRGNHPAADRQDARSGGELLRADAAAREMIL